MAQLKYTRYSFRLPRPLYELFRRVGEKKYPYGFNATAFIEQAIREFIKENKELLTSAWIWMNTVANSNFNCHASAVERISGHHTIIASRQGDYKYCRQ